MEIEISQARSTLCSCWSEGYQSANRWTKSGLLPLTKKVNILTKNQCSWKVEQNNNIGSEGSMFTANDLHEVNELWLELILYDT